MRLLLLAFLLGCAFSSHAQFSHPNAIQKEGKLMRDSAQKMLYRLDAILRSSIDSDKATLYDETFSIYRSSNHAQLDSLKKKRTYLSRFCLLNKANQITCFGFFPKNGKDGFYAELDSSKVYVLHILEGNSTWKVIEFSDDGVVQLHSTRKIEMFDFSTEIIHPPGYGFDRIFGTNYEGQSYVFENEILTEFRSSRTDGKDVEFGASFDENGTCIYSFFYSRGDSIFVSTRIEDGKRSKGKQKNNRIRGKFYAPNVYTSPVVERKGLWFLPVRDVIKIRKQDIKVRYQ